MKETQFIEKKSLLLVTNKAPGWKELAKDCVCFANSKGGKIIIGIEDNASQPNENQTIDENLPFTIRKRIAENTVNVAVNAEIIKAENGGEYLQLNILPSTATIASTSDGKYYFRSDDTCIPLLPDELSRLYTDKPSFIWETKRTRVLSSDIDQTKFGRFLKEIQNSTRVTSHVKQMASQEILEHYFFVDGEYLTNLGVLWLGRRSDRGKLLYSPTIHFLKFDETGQKVNKLLWEDHSLNPKELIEAIWTEIPDWKEGIDVADGIFRKFVPNYEEEVIRELIANALVHRPYTTRGDIFINLYPEKLEVVNPGLFPIGVTAQNILHKNVRRNPHLAQVFYDLHLMDKEGSGIDKMYQVLLSNAKSIPVPFQGDDFVQFTIHRRISREKIITLISRANEQYQLNSKEIISLGLIAQHNSLSAIEFSKELNLPEQVNVVGTWLGRLLDLGLINSRGKTKGTGYFVNSDFLKKTNFKGKTNLKGIENHRLEELIRQDISIYEPTPIRDIHVRIGKEISRRKIQMMLKIMFDKGILSREGKAINCKYSLRKKG